MTANLVVSDSSFYICFLNDITRPGLLIRIIESEPFQFVIGPVIKSEVKKSQNFDEISQTFHTNLEVFSYYKYGEIIRPLLSLDEIEKGEHELIVITYILHNRELKYKIILDDLATRNFLSKTYPKMFQNVTGTVGFIGYCTIKYKVFSKREGIMILNSIKKSKFRVRDEIVDEILKNIEVC